VCDGSSNWKENDEVSIILEIDKVAHTTRLRYVEYAMNRVRLLRHFKIQPYIVFDGGPLPAKRATDSERKRKRGDNLAEAKRLTAQGKHTQAREYYAKCADVTPEMAYQLIKVSDKIFFPWRSIAAMSPLVRLDLQLLMLAQRRLCVRNLCHTLLLHTKRMHSLRI
jgi:XPG N-terminal domain